MPLYNIETSTWNWDLPVNPPGGGSDSDTSGGSSHSAPVSQDPEVAESATYEEIFTSFMNALAGCLSASQPLLECECYATCTWSAANAHKALPRSEIKRKPDLVLSDDITAKWGNIRVSDPATSTSEFLDELGSQDPSSDDDLKSVVSDDSGSEECLTDSEDAPEGNSIESTMQMEEFPPSLPPVQPTMVSSAPLLSLTSQTPQDLTESISSIMLYPSQFPYSVHSPEPCGKICVGDDVYIIK
ncbi:uncharacterized protein BJ212DRAFT_1482853 [Suillus subaureus]|uniref:Uncharacterized protein n=1 Tax=Suillus subaureus TaxID=48587 RepID=A0A9P7E6J0_9AGAM|nr:uncharacterized protein BJ212DRAFT_1482853 [Suillus subaureus]KAG1812777.1 hypothetical protein BJ212DRAFT_1482853 [Suillus subaureus]